MRKVIVVGAGILGACLASGLAREGFEVTVLEREPVPGGTATARSFSWLNSTWGNTETYHRLRVASLAEWRILSSRIKGLNPDWCGSVLWDLPEDELRRSVPQLQGWGYNVELIDAAFAAKAEPCLRAVPEVAIHAPDEGMIEPVAAALAFLDDARVRGATVTTGVEVERLAFSDAKVTGVVLRDGTTIAADHVVLACGTGVDMLVEPLGQRVPIEAPPGLLVLTEPQEKLLNGLVISPRAHVRQRPDGRLIAGTDFAGADPGNDPDGVAEGILDALGRLIHSPSEIRLDSYTVGYRPTPKDGVSVVGSVVPGVSVAVTHSGVTLAPALAKFLVAEMVTGERDPLIQPFGPERFNE